MDSRAPEKPQDPAPLIPSADILRVPCPRTADLFTGLRKGKTTPDLFDQPTVKP